jgi:hypothetical protein
MGRAADGVVFLCKITYFVLRMSGCDVLTLYEVLYHVTLMYFLFTFHYQSNNGFFYFCYKSRSLKKQKGYSFSRRITNVLNFIDIHIKTILS